MRKANAYLSANKIIIICSPENIKTICEIVESLDDGNNVYYVIQPKPTGPIQALVLALPYCTSDNIAIVCADNVVCDKVWKMGTQFDGREYDFILSIPYTRMDNETAKRFTIVNRNGTDGVSFYKDKKNDHLGDKKCWIGPVYVNKDAFTKGLTEYYVDKTFEDIFNYIANNIKAEIQLYEADVIDIGVPGEMT